MHPVGSQGPQAALHLLQGSGLVGVALETPQPSHPDSRSLTTTVLSTGFSVTACELLPPVFQLLASPPVDSPGSSVSAYRSVTSADSHRTKRQAEGERQHHRPGSQRTEPGRRRTDGVPLSSQQPIVHMDPEGSQGTPTGLVGFQTVQMQLWSPEHPEEGPYLRRGTWPQIAEPHTRSQPCAGRHGGSPQPTLP